jgi:NAD(P)-dependent dehydrogenase (short-subunit alcohol dehydrogenase family)
MYPELQDKVTIISGAGGNLGLALAQTLHAAGGRLALIDMNAESLANRAAAAGINHSLNLAADLTKKAEVDAVVDQVVAHFGAVNALVNVAGGFRMDGPTHETSEETFDFLMTLNVKTAFLLSSAAARAMVAANKGGRIVNIGARAALTGPTGLAAYSASKSAVLRITESMASELLNDGITVNAVMPSVIDTPQNRAANPNDDHSKWVSPQSLASVISFLLSDSSRDISGALIPVYGRS